MIKKLSISGFRGFGENQTISFAVPDGEKPGSGLTIITGANNSGKTTIVESIRAFNGRQEPTFSEGRRNIQTGGKVELKLVDENDREYKIVSVSSGGSSTERSSSAGEFSHHIYVLQSRRYVPFEFGKIVTSKEGYIDQALSIHAQRSGILDQFEYRIFQIDKDREQFDALIKSLLGKDFQWTIEQRDSGSFYIKYTYGNVSHSGEGIGDGIWSIFTICAALYDSADNTTIVIDEPELSIHPALQKKLIKLFIEYSTKRQIILCTHSPYFIDWNAIADGANLIRVTKENINSKCYQIKDESRKILRGIITDLNNPHTLGIEASEVFFMEDGIILVEGQEDVVIYNRISQELGIPFNGVFFGWGAGGAPKIKVFLSLFRDLGYKKVVAIYDGDKREEADQTKREFPQYGFFVIAQDDIRDKKERKIQGKSGITYDNGKLKDEFRDYASSLIKDINNYLLEQAGNSSMSL